LAVIILLFSDIRRRASYPSGYPDQRPSALECHLAYRLSSDLGVLAIFRSLLRFRTQMFLLNRGKSSWVVTEMGLGPGHILKERSLIPE